MSYFPLAFLFVSPLTALAALVGAASIPIIIHLFNRRRFRIVDWAAMRFLLAAQKQNVRRMRLEQIVLLLVRTAVVVLLVLAMASVMPWAESFWQRWFPTAVVRAASTQRTHKILVLDGSMSMALRIEGTTAFDRARELAKQILDTSSGGDGFSVVLMASPPQRVVPEPSDLAGKVAEEINSLRLPKGNADLSATLAAVDDMLRRSPAKFLQREVYFLTDLQRCTWTSGRVSELTESLQRLQDKARLILVDVGREGVANLAVTSLRLGVPLATTGTQVPITAVVHHYGGQESKPVRVELLVGKAAAQGGDPPFAFRLVGQQQVTVPPGRNGVHVTFPYQFTTPGDYAIQVRVDGDALEPDDERSVVLSVKDEVPVMLVNGKPAAELYDRATEWLRDALNPFQTGAAPRNVPARPKVLSESQFADASLGDLTPFDCVYLCDVARLSSREVQRLETHLKRGGGVVFCLGPRVDVEAYNRLVWRGGEGILPGRLVGYQQAPEGKAYTLFAGEEEYKRPPLDAFAADVDRTSLQLARFRQYVRVELPPGDRARKVLAFVPEAESKAGPGNGGAARPVVGDPAVVEWTRQRGKVVLLTSTVNMDWTSWPISPSFPPFMQELLRFAVAGRLREQTAAVGDPLEEYLPSASGGLPVKVHTPDGRTATTETQPLDEHALFRFGETDQNGIYRVRIGQHPQDYLFAVNVPAATDLQQATESDLDRVTAEVLRDQYAGWNFQVVTALHEIVRSDLPEPTEGIVDGAGAAIARVLLLVLFVLLVVEVVLAWRFGHFSRSAGGTPPASGRLLPAVLAGSAAGVFLLAAGALGHAAWTGDFLGFLPDALRAGIERLLGVPAPLAGEGTRWRLEYTPYLTGHPTLDPLLIGLVALAALGLVGAIYVFEGHTAGGGYRALLAGLRAFTILLALVVLLPQLRLWFERQGWPNVVLLLDDSKSMSATDRYRSDEVRAAVEQLAKQAGLSEPQRLQLAQALLTRPDADWLGRLLYERQVKVHVYRCSARAQRLAEATEPADLAAAAQAIRDLQASGETSQLGTAVRQVLADFRGSSLSAIVMLTDGVTTEGEDLAAVSRHAAQVGVPLYFVGIGDAHEVRDLILHDLQVEDTVYVNDRLIFEVRVTGQGYSHLQVPVVLREKLPDGRLRELERKTVALDPAGKPVKVRLEHRPGEPGKKDFVIDVPEQPDELKPADNNRIERTVLVREAKLIRVLYVEGYPRWEYRYLKTLLEREADEPKNKTIDLKTLLLDADDDWAKQDRTARTDFPPRVELNQLDLVIVGDVDPRHPKLGDKRLQELADFVRERGGGLLMIAGERDSPRSYRDTPLKDVLPIEPLPGGELEQTFVEGYRPQLTPVGRMHPIFRFRPDEAENAAVWQELAEMFWFAEGYRTQPAAEVLAVHPRRLSAGLPVGGRDRGEGEKHPLVVHHFVGAGRCMFLGFDETWRWRLREDETATRGRRTYFNQFWIQVVRYLSRARLGRIDLRLDRQTAYRRGEPIRVMVRFPDDSPPPSSGTEVKVVVERRPLPQPGQPAAAPPETEVQTLQLSRLEGSRATYEGLLTRTPEGEYRFWLSSPAASGVAPRAECRVLPPPGEMERLRMNQPELEQAAERSHGRFYTLADADRLLDDLPAGTRVAVSAPRPPWLLWNHLATFALVLFVLTSEWVLRKRKHLL